MTTRIDIYGVIMADMLFGDASAGYLPVGDSIRRCSGDLELRINSPGGELTGLATIVAALHDWRAANPSAKCEVVVEALAASAAAYLLLMLPKGSVVKAYPMAALMYHSSSTLCGGGAGAMRDAARYLDSLDAVLRSALQRTAVPDALIDEWLAEGRQGWLNAEEAKLYGIVDEIVDGEAELPPVPADDEKYRAVALFYPENTQQKEPTMANTNKAQATAKAAESAEAQATAKAAESAEAQATAKAAESAEAQEPSRIEKMEQELAAGAEALAQAKAALSASEEARAQLAARVEELEQQLATSAEAQAKAEASLAALSGGLRCAVTPKAEVAKPTDWRSAIKAVASANPAMSQDDVFCEAARLYPELRAACISRVDSSTFNR